MSRRRRPIDYANNSNRIPAVEQASARSMHPEPVNAAEYTPQRGVQNPQNASCRGTNNVQPGGSCGGFDETIDRYRGRPLHHPISRDSAYAAKTDTETVPRFVDEDSPSNLPQLDSTLRETQ